MMMSGCGTIEARSGALGCSSRPVAHGEALVTVRLACEAMGTRFELVLCGASEPHLRAAGEAAIDEILHWHQRLNWFDPGSFVSHVNANAEREAVRCDGEFFELLTLCRDVWDGSRGAFDPTVAALMRAAGFRGDERDEAAIGRARREVGFDKVELDPDQRTIRFTRPALGLDFGAIGKGWALDRARALLADAGISTALLHGGTSSVVVIGSPPGEEGWTVAIGRRPDAPILRLRDAALGVSAPHGRVVDVGNETHGHVLDPRTGRSARAATLAAVIADSAAAADAWSTALLLENDRPGGMPPHMTSILAPHSPPIPSPPGDSRCTTPAGWRAAGPLASTLAFPAHHHSSREHTA